MGRAFCDGSHSDLRSGAFVHLLVQLQQLRHLSFKRIEQDYRTDYHIGCRYYSVSSFYPSLRWKNRNDRYNSQYGSLLYSDVRSASVSGQATY